MVERTLVLIKPDGVQKRLIGHIVSRFENKGLTISQLRMLTISSKLADQHYAEHRKKSFYPSLKSFITSGPSVAMVIEGENAIKIVRKMVGATDSAVADPGTIRGDFSISKGENIVHASDSAANAKKEIPLFFP